MTAGRIPSNPQAGTWYFQRAGWCPGDIVHPFVYDLTSYVTPGEQATVDYNMQPYVNADLSKPASYIIQAQVLYGREPNLTNDLEIMEIRRPNNDYMHRRMNPICSGDNPVVVVRNNGKNPITNLRISYGSDEELSVYDWSDESVGSIGLMDTAVITLPNTDLSAGGSIFTVTLAQPGVTDENPRNNTMRTEYTLPKSFSGVIYMTMRTDDFANDPEVTNGISYQVVDLAGTVIYQKGNFADRSIYRDTFRLHNGCYNFIINDDYVGDGLYPIQGAAGSYLLKDDQGRTIINAVSGGPDYLASFGNRQITPFIVTGSSSVNEEPSDEKSELLIYPNPTGGLFTVEFPQSVHGKGVTVQAYSASGEEVYSKSLTAAPSSMAVDFSGHADGVYMVKVTAGDVVWGKKVMVGRQ